MVPRKRWMGLDLFEKKKKINKIRVLETSSDIILPRIAVASE